MSTELVLYDIPSKGVCACWSPHTWRVRAVLNYKNISYKTEWIEYPEIPKLKEFGIPPNPEGSYSSYSVPVVRFPDGSYTMDSLPIVKRLDSLYPSHPILPDEKLMDKTQEVFGMVIFPLLAVFMPRICREVLREESVEWFKNDRSERAGMPLEQWEREKGGEEAWRDAVPGKQALASLLKDHKQDSGPFILGSKVCYADFVVVGICEMFKAPGSDLYERLVAPVDGLRELHEACAPWLERRSY